MKSLLCLVVCFTLVCSSWPVHGANPWKDIDPRLEPFYGYDLIRQDVDLGDEPVQTIVNGLKHKNPCVRWYCLYRLPDLVPAAQFGKHLATVEKLITDKDPTVQNAARFCLSILNGKMDHPSIVPHPKDKGTWAYYRYHDCRYNDGRVCIRRQNTITVGEDDFFSISELHWSPTGKYLAIKHCTRIEEYIDFIEVTTSSLPFRRRGPSGSDRRMPVRMYNWIDMLARGAGLERICDAQLRPDLYMDFLAWSPDETRAAVKLAYTVTEDQRVTGYAILQLTDGECIRIGKGEAQTTNWWE